MNQNFLSFTFRGIILILLFLGISIPAFGLGIVPAGKAAKIDNQTFIDANKILMFVTNHALLSRDLDNVFGHDYGTYYPFDSVEAILNGTQIKSPLYSGGLWMGGKVNDSLRVAIADFDTEYWPGPISSGTYIPHADTIAAYRVYKLSADSASSNPNADYLQWPISQGAPIDNYNHPDINGIQTLWSVFNDANPSRHTLIAGGTPPLGVEVRQTTWAYDDIGRDKIIFIDYQLFNKGGNSISDFYFSFWLDPDLGYMEDDLTGCDTLSDIYFCYNADDSDRVYGNPPPAIGVKLVYGPAVSSPGDTATFFRTHKPGFRNLRMSSFISYPNGDDPQTGAESYNLMKGLKRNGDPLANGTPFSYPGDPVTSTGDIQLAEGNPHFLVTFGPIEFPSGDSQYVFLKLGIGQGVSRLNSITNLKELLNAPDTFATDLQDDARGPLPVFFCT